MLKVHGYKDVYLHAFISRHNDGGSLLFASFGGPGEAVKSCMGMVVTWDNLTAEDYTLWCPRHQGMRMFVKRLPSSFAHGVVIDEDLLSGGNETERYFDFFCRKGKEIDTFFRHLYEKTDIPLLEDWREGLFKAFIDREMVIPYTSYGPYQGYNLGIPGEDELLEIIKEVVGEKKEGFYVSGDRACMREGTPLPLQQ